MKRKTLESRKVELAKHFIRQNASSKSELLMILLYSSLGQGLGTRLTLQMITQHIPVQYYNSLYVYVHGQSKRGRGGHVPPVPLCWTRL